MPTKTKTKVRVQKEVKKPVGKKKPVMKKSSPVHKSESHHHASKTFVPEHPIEKIIYKFQKHFVFIPRCQNCHHAPMRVDKLVAIMAILVGVLSSIVIAQFEPISFSELLVEAQILTQL